jgi:hypothetical protein
MYCVSSLWNVQQHSPQCNGIVTVTDVYSFSFNAVLFIDKGQWSTPPPSHLTLERTSTFEYKPKEATQPA